MQDKFAQQVRNILDHLYDYEYLQESSVAHAMDPSGKVLPRERMRLLRSTVLECIEKLHPGGSIAHYSPRVRSYNVLNLHYVDRLTIQQVASELALSERQVYRDLRQAEQDLAVVLWGQIQRLDASQPAAGEPSRLELALRELSRLPNELQAIDICALLQGAVEAVSRLAQQRDVLLSTSCLAMELGTVRGDRQTVRQVLIGMLSFVIQHTRLGTELAIIAKLEATSVAMELYFAPDDQALEIPEVMAGLIERLGGAQRLVRVKPDAAVLTLVLTDQRPYHVLVIDDNEGLLALFQRYLTGEQYHVTGARDGLDGLRQAKASAPDVIFLDVLMPGQDGWEVLQRIKEIAETRAIPVVVCSVLDSPALAYSLGASGYLAKPVSRQNLIEELSRWCPGL